LCKLPWNDVMPEGNKQTKEPAKFMAHVENYLNLFYAVTGRKILVDGAVEMSERVYNFQRIFNLRMGFGKREHDTIPYRAVGPVTSEEYESRRERYDKQLKEKLGINTENMKITEKMTTLRRFREGEYEKLKDSVYTRRGWNLNGLPTIEKARSLRIDFPDVVELLERNL